MRKGEQEACVSVLYVLFASSCRETARESYDKSPEKVYSRFDFAKARGAPVREYRDSRIKKNTVFDFKLFSIYIRTLLRCICTKATTIVQISQKYATGEQNAHM